MNEQAIVNLLKEKYKVGVNWTKAMTDFGEETLKKIGSEEKMSKMIKDKSLLIDENRIINYSCLKAGDSKMIRHGNKYLCSTCKLSFNTKIWDNAVKAILNYRKAMNELGKLENRFTETDYMTYEEEQKLQKKYGKEPWWDSTANWRMRFMGWRE